jgi:metalloendopeptidase OMA1, mitochondrial
MLAIRALTGSSRVKLSSVLLQRNFHKSPQKQAIPPQFLILIRPLLKGAAFFAGRSFRKWWRGLPKEEKEIHYQKLKARKNYIAGGKSYTSFFFQ